MIRYAIAGLLLGCAGVPIMLWYPPVRDAVISVGHQGQHYPISAIPVAVVVVPVAPPQREIRTFAWFVAHPSTIEPARVHCQRGSDAIPAECQNADRASLHVFNQSLREQYFGKGIGKP